jgi:hypothetical protein
VEQLSKMVEELTDRCEVLLSKNQEGEKIGADLRLQTNELSSFLHQKEVQIAHGDQLLAQLNDRMGESEHNYRLLLGANEEYQRILTDQASKYNEARQECQALQDRLQQGLQNE